MSGSTFIQGVRHLLAGNEESGHNNLHQFFKVIIEAGFPNKTALNFHPKRFTSWKRARRVY